MIWKRHAPTELLIAHRRIAFGSPRRVLAFQLSSAQFFVCEGTCAWLLAFVFYFTSHSSTSFLSWSCFALTAALSFAICSCFLALARAQAAFADGVFHHLLSWFCVSCIYQYTKSTLLVRPDLATFTRETPGRK